MNQCFLCNHPLDNRGLQVRDHYASGELFVVNQCSYCGLCHTYPKPALSDLPGYYKTETYISHTSAKTGVFNKLYRLFQQMNLRLKLHGIRQKGLWTGRLLDIGCGNGAALSYFIKRGWNGVGVEPAPGARDFAIQLGLTVYDEQFLDELPSNSFDLVTLWHVLEHVPDVPGRMKQIRRLIKPDGLLVIALPNPDSFDAGFYKSYWAAWDVPRHLTHFSKRHIEELARQYGFVLVDIKPMWFDSFYVSLTSEKYKGSGFLGIVRALVVGLISNLAVKNTSSLTYYLRPKQESA